MSLGRGSNPANSTIAADDFHRFIDDKVAGVRAPPPQITTAPLDCLLHHFTLLTTDDVVASVRQLSDKRRGTDSILRQISLTQLNSPTPKPSDWCKIGGVSSIQAEL